MFSLPEHALVSCSPNQSSLVLRSQSGRGLSDSAVVMQMLAAGVCGTDLALLTRTRPRQATVLGHEGVGMVVHAPEDSGVSKGSRVIINPVHSRKPAAVIGHSRDGIFRDWFWLDSREVLDGQLLVSCPRGCPLESAELALAEPIGSVLYSLGLLKENGGTGLLVIRGSGTVAILAARLWARFTGSAAVVVSKSETHARWLQEVVPWPANVAICCYATLPAAIHTFGSETADAGLLCCTREDAPAGLRLLLDVVKPGGFIDLMAGFPAEYKEERLGDVVLDRIRWDNICGVNCAPPTAVEDRPHRKTVYLIGHRGTAERHILEAIDLMWQRVVSPSDLPQRVVSLDELPEVVHQMISRSNAHTNWVKTVVAFTRKDFESH